MRELTQPVVAARPSPPSADAQRRAARWDLLVELAVTGPSPVDLMEQTRTAMPAATEASRALVDWFIDVVATGPAAPAPRRNLFTR